MNIGTTVHGGIVPIATCVMLAVAGCGPGRPARVVAPPLDPAAVVAAVDADGDGSIGDAEIRAVPALASAIPQLDGDGDGKLSAAELRGWLEAVRDSRVAISSITVAVTQKGKPLAGATVRFVPERCMGAGMQPAEGTTDASGAASPTIRDAKYPGVNCGLYRVEIAGTGVDGKPLDPGSAAGSPLGLAVGGALPENGIVTFALE